MGGLGYGYDGLGLGLGGIGLEGIGYGGLGGLGLGYGGLGLGGVREIIEEPIIIPGCVEEVVVGYPGYGYGGYI